jgi:hypothetical protein
MRDLMAAETAKTAVGRALPVLVSSGVALALTTVVSLAAKDARAVAAGTMTAGDATDDAVRYWMTLHLLAALFGALFVTREFARGTITRSVLLAGGRGRLVAAKAVAGFVIGLGLAGIAALGAAVSPWVFLAPHDVTPQWTGRTWAVLAGVVAVVALAAPWGVLVGWIARSQVVAVGFLVLTTVGLEPLLFDAVPALGRCLPTIAMSSVYLDTKAGLLPVPVALAVLGAWLAAAWIVADRRFARQDVQ